MSAPSEAASTKRAIDRYYKELGALCADRNAPGELIVAHATRLAEPKDRTTCLRLCGIVAAGRSRRKRAVEVIDMLLMLTWTLLDSTCVATEEAPNT